MTRKSFGRLVKHPDDKPRVSIDWSDWLAAAGVTISSSGWENASAGNVTLSETQIVDGTKTTALLSGGTDQEHEYIENKVVFSDSSEKVYTLLVVIDDNIIGN